MKVIFIELPDDEGYRVLLIKQPGDKAEDLMKIKNMIESQAPKN